MPTDDRTARSTALKALAADAVLIVVFATIGRRSHAEGLTVSGVAETAWPFLTGAGVGWLLTQGWKRPASLAPTGLVVWICTVVIAMLLRKATSAGTAASFIVVASLVTAFLLLGWRAVAGLIARRSHRQVRI